MDTDQNIEDAAKSKAQDYSGQFEQSQVAALEALFKSQPFTIMERTWPGGMFYDSRFLGGNAVLDYNMSHCFWETIYKLVESLGDEDIDAADIAREIRVMLDLLLIAHAKAESVFSVDAILTAREFTDHLRSQWGILLNSYVNTRHLEREEDAGKEVK